MTVVDFGTVCIRFLNSAQDRLLIFGFQCGSMFLLKNKENIDTFQISDGIIWFKNINNNIIIQLEIINNIKIR